MPVLQCEKSRPHFTLSSETAFRIGRSFSHITFTCDGTSLPESNQSFCQPRRERERERERTSSFLPPPSSFVRPLQSASQQEFASDSLGHHQEQPLVRPSLTNLSTSYHIALQTLVRMGHALKLETFIQRTQDTLLNEDLRIRLKRGVRRVLYCLF